MSLESVEVVVRGYRAFIDGDFEAIGPLILAIRPGDRIYPRPATLPPLRRIRLVA